MKTLILLLVSFATSAQQIELAKPSLIYTDTVKVLMLLGDTSTIKFNGQRVWQHRQTENGFGYKIREYYKAAFVEVEGYYLIKGYLDLNKKPLPLNFVVWMSVEIKKADP